MADVLLRLTGRGDVCRSGSEVSRAGLHEGQGAERGRWLQRLFDESRGFPTLAEPRWAPAADVYETVYEVVVTAAVPGFDRDELDLTLIPEGLTIRGEKHEERDEGDRDSRFLDYRYGRFVRSVPLPPGLDLDRAEARLKNGVLTIRFPKAAHTRLRAV